MKRYFSLMILLLSMSLTVSSCGGGGGGGGGGSGGTTTTTVSGKVTLSNTVSGKPALFKAARLKGMAVATKGSPGSGLYYSTKRPSTNLTKTLLATSQAAGLSLSGANVYLYNSDHPEWLCPVSDTTTGTDGSYTMTTLKNASCNKNAYSDGGGIPVGKYTLLAYKAGGFDPVLGITTPSVVAIQTVVQSFDQAAVLGKDLVAQPSEVAPTVKAMFGLPKNTDGTQTWGGASTTLPANAAIQVSFSMAMSRGSLATGIAISPPVDGAWSLSPDWLTATFYPDPSGTNKITPNTIYTVTVKGSDKNSTTAITNVYGNKLALTATGTFKATAADSIAPTAEWESPTTAEMVSPVDVIKPIRIRANKQLDVNTLLLEGTVGGVSALGAKPGVLYVGKNASNLYVYEFVLGEPLKLSTNYTLKVSGGKGLNGIIMNELNGSLQTISADLSTGISPTANPTTQMAQAQVKDVFGKWVRGFNDRNISQVQSVMSVDAYMEYDISRGFDSKDVNRDGRYSSQEFSTMLANDAFPNWEYCQTTVTGDVVGIINIVGATADFEFRLTGTSSNTSQQCADSLPSSSFYATLQKINGAWFIVRFSEGIDTRNRQISYPSLITGSLQEVGVGVVPDGGQLTGVPGPSVVAKWTWDTVSGVSAYVVMIIDARNTEKGIAFALSSNKTSIDTSTDPVSSQGAVDVTNRFGFNSGGGIGFQFVEGGQYFYEVIGLASITTADIANKTDIDLMRDIAAMSPVRRFGITGVYKELTTTVYPGATATGTPATFSENFGGYDVGSASKATIVVTTPSLTTTSGMLNIFGFGFVQHPLNWTCDASNCTAQVTVDLYKGWNWIDMHDALGMYKSFGIQTTGGMPPVITFTSIKDDISTSALAGDSWNFYTANPGATKITISGSVASTDPSTGMPTNMTQVQVYVNNGTIGAYGLATAPVTSGVFSVTVDIYKGDNWINVGDPMGNYQNHFGVYTNTGSVWVPPIGNINVVTATKSYDWGNSSDWDASADSDNIVTVSGKFKTPLLTSGNCGSAYTYNIWREGAGTNGTLAPLADGSFSLPVDLYKGWNYVNLQDPNCTWYGVNIFTTNGMLKPKFVEITSPASNATGVIGVKTVTATWSELGTGYAPSVFNANVQAGVWDAANGWCTYNWYYYSSDPYNQVTYGDLPITISGSTVTFNVDFDTGQCETYISLYGYDNVNLIEHGHQIYVNAPVSMPEYLYKPGIKTKAISR